MANFTLELTVGIGKGAAASWYYAPNAVGHSYGNPLDLQIGDTVTFTRDSGSNGTAKVRLLNIFTNNADIDLTASSPTVVRTVASGGTTLDAIEGRNGATSNPTIDDFFLERQAAPSVSAPTASSVTFNNPASANTTATVNLSASGSGGTLQYACEVGDSTPDNWQSGSTFTISRGSGTVYARARRSSTTNSNTVSATRPGFLTGDTAVSATNDTIGHSDSTASTTLSNATAGETYAVRVNNGSTNLATRTGNGAISFTSSLPSAGNTSTYEIFVRRPTSTGGDGSTFTATNDTFTVTRGSVPAPDAPTNLSFSTAATASSSTSVTVTASGGGTGTLKVSADGSTWYANGTSFGSRTRGTAHTWYARVEGTSNSSNYTEAHTPPYIDPDASISAISSPNLAYGSTTHVVTIAGGNDDDQYYVYNNAGSVNYGGITGNGTLTITHGVAAGGAATFRVYTRKPVNIGGDNAFDDTGTTFEVEVYPNSTSLSVSDNNAAAASVTVTLSATGGQGGTIEYAKTSYSGTTTYAQNRGTTVTYYSRSEGGNGLISTVSSVNHAVGYLAPAGGTPGNSNIFTGGTSHTASISGGSSGTVYEFRSGSYTGTILATVNGNGSAACSGGAGTYYVTRYKTTGTGGSGTTGRTNLATYTVTAISKQTFTIKVNYLPAETGTPPFLLAPTVTVDVGSITGNLTSSSNPLEVSVDDDVIWKKNIVQNTAEVFALSNFTNNNAITLSVGSGTTRTLANGTNNTDAISVTVDAGANGSDADTYYIERVGGITPPSGLSSSLSGNESQTETVTLNLSTSGSNGTLEYLQRTVTSMSSTGWQASNQFSQPRNSTRYYYASRNRNSGSFTGPLTVTVNYLGAVTTGYSFDTASGNIGYGDGAPAISFTAAQANHTVAIFEGSTIRSAAKTGETDYNNIATNETPPAGGSNTYNLRTYRNSTAGGNPSPSYVATSASTITIKKYPQTPSGLTTFTDGGTAAASGTFTIAVGSLDGASSTTITLSSNYTTNAVANGSAIANVVRAGDVIYARNTGANGLTAQAAISTPATYLLPNAPSLSNISNAYNTPNHSIDITNLPTTVYYEVRTGSYTGTLRGALTNGGGGTSKSLTVTQINTGGDTVTYYVRGYRLATAGGDEGYDNLGTYTVTEAPAPTYSVTAPTSINEGSSGTINVTTANVANNTTLYYKVEGVPFSTSNISAADFGGSVPSGSFTISSNAGSFTVTPTADLTTEGQETARVTIRTGSTSGTVVATDDFNIIDTSLTPNPPTNLTFSTATTASSSTSVTVTASGGGTGTLKVSPDGSTWSANGTTFSNRARGTAHTWYARVESTSNSSNYTEAHTPPYLNPDLEVTATNDSISITDTSASTTIGGMTAGETVAIRVNNGTTNLATRVGNGALSFTGSLPNSGNSTTYELFTSRPTSAGGSASFVPTDVTFTVTRASPTLTPNSFTFTDESPVARNEEQISNLITVAGLSSGYSTSVSVSGGTYSKNGTAYSSSNTTAVNGDTFRVKHTSSSLVSTAVNTTLTIGGVSDIYTTTTTSSYCPTTNTTHTITGITTTSSGTLSQTSIVSSNYALTCSLTTPYVWLSSFNPGGAATRSNIVSVSVTSGGGTVSLNRTNNSTSHTITYTPPAITTESTAVIRVQHRKQTSYYSGDSGSYQWPNLNQGALTTVNITVTICPVSQTSVSITSVDDVTPVEGGTDVVTATAATASGVTISSYAWTTSNANIISLSSSTVQSPTLTFKNVTSNQTATIGVTVTDSTGTTATASQAYTVQFVNQAPIASITGASSVLVNTAANFDGATSYDPDGTTSLTFAFAASIAGSTINTQSASSTETYSFTPTSAGQYTISLTVSDGTASTTTTKSLLALTSANATTTSGGGYGFEIYNAAGAAVIRSDELIIRKAKVVSANSSGAASTTVTGTETATKIIGTTVGEDNAGAEVTVTGTTTKSVSITNALANQKIYLYLLR